MGDNLQMYVDDHGHLQYTSAMTTMNVNNAGHLLYNGTIAPVIQHYIIDVSSNNNYVQVPVMQGDGAAARFAEIELISCGTQFDLSGLFATIAGTKPDGTQIMNSCIITEDNYIMVEITQQMAAVPGRGEYCVTLFQGDQNTVIKSFPFYILVTKSPYDVSEIVSQDEFSALGDVMSKALADYDRVMEATHADVLSTHEDALQTAADRQDVTNNTTVVTANTATCIEKANIATTKATEASTSETNAHTYMDYAQSYALGTNGRVRSNDGVDNAFYYYERAKALVAGLSGAFIPMGSYFFEELDLSDQLPGFTYNIKNAFVTTADFREGAGIPMPAGTNIYVTSDMKWDTMVGAAVTGVKGEAEQNYRTGNITITREQMGIKYTAESSTVPTDPLAEYWEFTY